MSRHLDLLCESLENRLLLAGDVTAFVNASGDLIVRGDAADNEVVVTSLNGAFQVEGEGGTTINGQSTFEANDVTGGMNIRLRGGNDELTLEGGSRFIESDRSFTVEDRVFVKMGAGNDIVNINGLKDLSNGATGMRIADLYIKTKGGSDFVNLTSVDSDKATILTCSGNDHVDVNNVGANYGSGGSADPLIDTLIVCTFGGSDEVCVAGDFQSAQVGLSGGAGTDTFLGTSSFSSDTNFNRFEELFANCGDDVDPDCNATFAGSVWRDDNNSGVRDANELGVEGILISLFDADNQVIATDTTDSVGEYSFTELCEGDYRIVVDRDSLSQFNIDADYTDLDVGGDDTVDSDVDKTGQSDFYSVSDGNDQLHVDAGVIVIDDTGPR